MQRYPPVLCVVHLVHVQSTLVRAQAHQGRIGDVVERPALPPPWYAWVGLALQPTQPSPLTAQPGRISRHSRHSTAAEAVLPRHRDRCVLRGVYCAVWVALSFEA